MRGYIHGSASCSDASCSQSGTEFPGDSPITPAGNGGQIWLEHGEPWSVTQPCYSELWRDAVNQSRLSLGCPQEQSDSEAGLFSVSQIHMQIWVPVCGIIMIISVWSSAGSVIEVTSRRTARLVCVLTSPGTFFFSFCPRCSFA